jgi:ribosomal protein S18 acetylase RimI-like enzyme
MTEIRELNKEDDFNDLIELSQEFFQEYESHHKDFFKIDQLKDDDIISYFSSFCGVESRKSFIAVEGKRIVAYITVYVIEQAVYWKIKKVGEISGLMVQKDYRHTGIAKRLLASARDFFKAEAVNYFTVFTAVENRAAIDFYKNNDLIPLYTTLIGETYNTTDTSIHGK